MIADIKNPWVRRSVLVAVLPLGVVLHVIVAIGGGLWELCLDARDAWQGSAK